MKRLIAIFLAFALLAIGCDEADEATKSPSVTVLEGWVECDTTLNLIADIGTAFLPVSDFGIVASSIIEDPGGDPDFESYCNATHFTGNESIGVTLHHDLNPMGTSRVALLTAADVVFEVGSRTSFELLGFYNVKEDHTLEVKDRTGLAMLSWVKFSLKADGVTIFSSRINNDALINNAHMEITDRRFAIFSGSPIGVLEPGREYEIEFSAYVSNHGIRNTADTAKAVGEFRIDFALAPEATPPPGNGYPWPPSGSTEIILTPTDE